MLLRSQPEGDMTDQDRERWTKLVADFETSELTQREFASERGISFSNLRNWIYRLRKESRPLVAEAAEEPRQAPRQEPAKKGSRLVPVRVVASAAKPRTRTLVAGEVESRLELALPSGTCIRFPAGTDLAYLRALASALSPC
jgi:transposase